MIQNLTKLFSVLCLTTCIMSVNTSAQEKKEAQEPNNQKHTVQIAAHRGFWNTEQAGFAQNSIKSFSLAQQNHFWGSEFDVHLTKDNVVVVNHDETIDGKAICNHNFSDFNYYKLKNGEKLPTLDDYLEQAAKCKTTKLVLEIKIQQNEARTIELTDFCLLKLMNHGLYDPSRVIFISFSLAACKHLAIVAPQFCNQFLSDTEDYSPKAIHEFGINGIDYDYHVFLKKPEWIQQAKELGMSTNAWTVNEKKDIQFLIDHKIDCITTNFPLLVRELLNGNENCIKEE